MMFDQIIETNFVEIVRIEWYYKRYPIKILVSSVLVLFIIVAVVRFKEN